MAQDGIIHRAVHQQSQDDVNRRDPSTKGQSRRYQEADLLHSGDGKQTETPRGRAGETVTRTGMVLMLLLALQYGLQPLLTRKFVSHDAIISTQVIACEVVKVYLGIIMLYLEGDMSAILSTWTPESAFVAAGVPSLIYAIQNVLIQVSYRHLDDLTFTMLNQTKLLSTAFFNFVFLRLGQSRRQLAALALMFLAAVLLTSGQKGGRKPPSDDGALQSSSFLLGAVPLLVASMTSGMGSTYCQWVMQVRKRSPHLLTIELCCLTSLVLAISTIFSPDGHKIRTLGFFHKWTALSIIPVFTNAIGGVLVGLVTKHVGGVKKGFMVISALIVTAIAQFFVEGTIPSASVWFALPLVVSGTYIHSSYQRKEPQTQKKSD